MAKLVRSNYEYVNGHTWTIISVQIIDRAVLFIKCG